MNFFRGSKKDKGTDCSKLFMDPMYSSIKLYQAGDVTGLVSLPIGEDLNEWLASNTANFLNNLRMLYLSIEEFCDSPIMTAGPKVEYVWNNDKGKKTKGLSAAQYIDLVMTTSQKQLNDDAIFPTKHGSTFPRDFLITVKKHFRLYFHVFAHIYYVLFSNLIDLEMVGHFNTLLMHFILFAQEFDLLDPKDMLPLAELSKVLISPPAS